RVDERLDAISRGRGSLSLRRPLRTLVQAGEGEEARLLFGGRGRFWTHTECGCTGSFYHSASRRARRHRRGTSQRRRATLTRLDGAGAFRPRGSTQSGPAGPACTMSSARDFPQAVTSARSDFLAARDGMRGSRTFWSISLPHCTHSALGVLANNSRYGPKLHS